MRQSGMICGFVLIALSLVGCTEKIAGPKTVSVSGVLKIGGKPAAGVDVHFVADGFASYGKTDAEGKYRLVQGAVAGKNKIYFSKIVGTTGLSDDPESGMDAGQFQAMATSSVDPQKAAAGQTIPPEYSSPTTTKLEFPVPDGGTDSANFDI